jgi:hypothetical protein
LQKIKSEENVEGFVILFEDTSEIYKIKTDWYFERANQKKTAEFSLTSERGVWNLCLAQQFDDAAAFMDPVMRKAVEAFSDRLFRGLAELVQRIVALCRTHEHTPKRDFVKACQALDQNAYPQSLCFQVFDRTKEGADPFELVSEWALKQSGTGKGLDVLRAAIGGDLRFTEKVTGAVDGEEAD